MVFDSSMRVTALPLIRSSGWLAQSFIVLYLGLLLLSQPARLFPR
jgi:hypothetical protein